MKRHAVTKRRSEYDDAVVLRPRTVDVNVLGLEIKPKRVAMILVKLTEAGPIGGNGPLVLKPVDLNRKFEVDHV